MAAKYHNTPVDENGRSREACELAGLEFKKAFDSRREAHRYHMLKHAEAAGLIRRLQTQVEFPLYVHDHKGKQQKLCTYKADFTYERLLKPEEYLELKKKHPEQLTLPDFNTGFTYLYVVEDAKGHRTEMYRLKKKLMLYLYGIEILET